jgi:hypothetical protein
MNDDDQSIFGEVGGATADEFVTVAVPVHIDDLASFHAAVASWAATASGGKGRTRVS